MFYKFLIIAFLGFKLFSSIRLQVRKMVNNGPVVYAQKYIYIIAILYKIAEKLKIL